MPSASQSKAQRRAESQQRAAERRAAELRAKRVKIYTRVGGAIVLVAVIVLIATQLFKSSGPPPSQKNPHVTTSAIPASLHLTKDPTDQARV